MRMRKLYTERRRVSVTVIRLKHKKERAVKTVKATNKMEKEETMEKNGHWCVGWSFVLSMRIIT